MELVFRKLGPETPAPAAEEIYLAPAAAADRQRRDLAALVLEKGPGVLLQGSAPVERLIVSADPTFDDMLAAAFVQRQAAGAPLSAGCQAFARYAGLVREGLRPGQFPLEQSIEGIYLALRGEAEQDPKGLENPETAQKFLHSWGQMATLIFQAADAGKDPFAAPLFTSGADFARERAFLAKDLDVYRLDFAQGEAWQVQLPGVAVRSLGLLLHHPKALLFKYWTRMQCPAPLDGPYSFLAVNWGKGKWVFSTDPVQKMSLKALADLLQASEPTPLSADPPTAGWFDGKPFQHTLIGAPHGGTKMPDKTVLRLVKKWCKAGPAKPPSRLPRYVALAACILAAVIGLVAYSQVREPQVIEVYDLNVFTVGISEYQNFTKRLPAPADDADALVEAFKNQKGKLFKEVYWHPPLKNSDATRANILNNLDHFLFEEREPNRGLKKRSLVIVALSGHGFLEKSTKKYHFCPYDYDPEKPGSTGLYLAEMQRYLDVLPCTVVLLLDTCHSGAPEDDKEAAQNAEALRQDIAKYVNDSLKLLKPGQKKSLVVIAACGPEQVALETQKWKHGALMLAFLEGLDGQRRYKVEDDTVELPRPNARGFVTLQEMDRYATSRVRQLCAELPTAGNHGQEVSTVFTGNIVPAQIPIAQRQP